MDEEEVVEGGSAAEAPDDEAALPAQHPEPPPGPSPLIDTSVREVGENPDNLTDTIEITTLTNTTSVHDDWLHRGPFLADLDLHTYVTYVLRSPRPVKARLADTQRVEHVFAFDDHYELAKSHWQQLKTQGQNDTTDAGGPSLFTTGHEQRRGQRNVQDTYGHFACLPWTEPLQRPVAVPTSLLSTDGSHHVQLPAAVEGPAGRD